MNKPKLSVIIPQYNELSNLKKGLLHEAFVTLDMLDLNYEVIVVDDGSTDEGLNYLKNNYSDKQHLKIIESKHGGKPSAILHGLNASGGEYVLLSDMDQSTPMKEVKKLLPFMGQYQAIIGSRGGKRNSASILRKISGLMFSTFRRVFILRRIDDTQCGFKLFDALTLKKVYPRLNALKTTNVHGWSVSAFDVELLYLIQRTGGKIKEVKVDWKDEDVSDTKKRKFFKESLDMLKQVMMVVGREITGRYSS